MKWNAAAAMIIRITLTVVCHIQREMLENPVDEHGPISEVMLPDGEEDLNDAHFVMSVHLFSNGKSLIVNAAYLCAVFLCFAGIFVRSRSVIKHYKKEPLGEHLKMPFSLTVTLENTSIFNRMFIFTAKVNKSMNEQNQEFSVYSHLDINYWSYDGNGFSESTKEIESKIVIPENGITSDAFHLFTGRNLNNEKSTFIVNFANATSNITEADLSVSYFDATVTKAQMVLCICGILIVCLIYATYRMILARSDISDASCLTLFMSVIMMVVGNDLWTILTSSAEFSLVFVCIAKALLVWLQRFTIHALGRDRGANSRFSVPEVIAFVLAALAEVVIACVGVQAYYRFPFSYNQTVAICGTISLVLMTVWAVYTVFKCGNSFFYTFVLVTWFGEGLGTLVDKIQGNFKDTCFQISQMMVPIVTNVFLCVMMWPVAVTKQEVQNPDPEDIYD